jgi:hypothetical protein
MVAGLRGPAKLRGWWAAAGVRGSQGRRGCWVGLEGRVGVDSLGILVLGLKGIQTQKEFKPEFKFQQTKEMHQHECNN